VHRFDFKLRPYLEIGWLENVRAPALLFLDLTEETAMQWVTVLYPNKAGARFDFVYYKEKHIPMVEGLLNTKIEVRKGIPSPGSPLVPFVCTASIHINSVDEFAAAMAKHGQQVLGDIPNYTDIQPIVQIEETL
jgi:uncharacterized protein (TIGR02118 family)